MNGQSIWLKYSQDIQLRLLSGHSQLLAVKSAKTLYQQLSKALNQAHNEGFLATNLSKICKLLRLSSQDQRQSVILGGLEKAGTKNFKRSKDLPHFSRTDGCWFDFAITINESQKFAEIIGFDFEIRFPESMPVEFLRFDLNLPGHNNQNDGLRFHLHPGCENLMIHSPPMSPLEILHLFLYGFEIPQKMRRSNNPKKLDE